MKKILYIGGFELPDKGAAAIRVINNAKLLKECGIDTYLLGVHKNKDRFINKGSHLGFVYETIKYPTNLREWLYYLTHFSSFDVVEREKPDIVILYDFPGLAIIKWYKYCKNRGVKVVGDVTEWYMPTGNVVMKFLRSIDTKIRMQYAHHMLDGMMTISRYLYDYYNRAERILLPPLMDKEAASLYQNCELPDTLTLVYAGSGGGKNKDRLDLIVEAINQLDSPNIIFKIIGVDEEKFEKMYKCSFKDKWNCIRFLGRLDHTRTIKEIQSSHFQIFVRPINRVTTAGFPSKLVESFGLGVPVITNKTSNISDFVKDGINSFLLDTYMPEEIKKILERLLSMSEEDIMMIRQKCKEDLCFDYRTYKEDMNLFLKNVINK